MGRFEKLNDDIQALADKIIADTETGTIAIEKEIKIIGR